VLAAFVGAFLVARILVLLIMTRRIPDVYLHVGGTHFHHLNIGIFLLAAVGAYLLVRRPEGREQSAAAIVYGVGLALTFDEMGMWIHLGGDYWTRAGFDAVVIIAAALGLIVAAPALRQFRPRHWLTAAALLLAVAVFALLAAEALDYTHAVILPRLRQIETTAPR
jgi:hypothetical protein